MPNSSAMQLKCACENNISWVVRLKRKGSNTNVFSSSKRLFTSYIATKLAQEFGISTPDTELAKLKMENKLFESLNLKESFFDENCQIGVASKYVNFIDKQKYFKNYNEFESFLLSSEELITQICGMKVFLNWIYLEDFGKEDNLQLDKDFNIYFVDFDMAFNNSSSKNIWSSLDMYFWGSIITNPAKYFDSVFNKIKYFEYWFDRLITLDFEKIFPLLDTLPECWEIPIDYPQSTLSFLSSNREQFISQFKQALKLKDKFNQ